MSTLNVRNGSKVRVFVTPSRITRGKVCSENTCPIALALVEQLGLKNVSVGPSYAMGVMSNGVSVELTPTGENHRKFVRGFDRGDIRSGRVNITYKVRTYRNF